MTSFDSCAMWESEAKIRSLFKVLQIETLVVKTEPKYKRVMHTKGQDSFQRVSSLFLMFSRQIKD